MGHFELVDVEKLDADRLNQLFDNTIGALNIYGADEGAFDDTTRELATAFASYAAVALANADLYASTATLAANL